MRPSAAEETPASERSTRSTRLPSQAEADLNSELGLFALILLLSAYGCTFTANHFAFAFTTAPLHFYTTSTIHLLHWQICPRKPPHPPEDMPHALLQWLSLAGQLGDPYALQFSFLSALMPTQIRPSPHASRLVRPSLSAGAVGAAATKAAVMITAKG